MSILTRLRGSECAVQLTSREAAAMLPPQGNRRAWHAVVTMPAGAVTPRLQGPNLDAESVGVALRQLAEALPRRVRAVTLVLPDAAVRSIVVPIEAGAAVNRRTRSEIVRWALRDVLPYPVEEAQVDEQLFEPAEAARCLLVAAVHRDVLRQYEDVATALGPVVRVLPATLAFGWTASDTGTEGLLVYADDDAVGCMVTNGEAPLFVRTRPRHRAGVSMVEAVLETLDYVADRLGTGGGNVAVAGLAAGNDDLEAGLAQRGWRLDAPPESAEAAHLAALRGALRAAQAGT